jgi:hypothetical protein
MMPTVVSALLAFVAALFQSHASLCPEHLAHRHQISVNLTNRPSPATTTRAPICRFIVAMSVRDPHLQARVLPAAKE